MKNLSIKIVFLSIIIASGAVGMDRPVAMGMARSLTDNCLIRMCGKCCSYECCPPATLISLGQAWLCACAIKPDLSDRCGSDQATRIVLAGAGVLALGALGANVYINKSIKKN